jgi:hypothetical protein
MEINLIILPLLAISLIGFCFVIGRRLKRVISGIDTEDNTECTQTQTISSRSNAEQSFIIDSTIESKIKNNTPTLTFQRTHLTPDYASC